MENEAIKATMSSDDRCKFPLLAPAPNNLSARGCSVSVPNHLSARKCSVWVPNHIFAREWVAQFGCRLGKLALRIPEPLSEFGSRLASSESAGMSSMPTSTGGASASNVLPPSTPPAALHPAQPPALPPAPPPTLHAVSCCDAASAASAAARLWRPSFRLTCCRLPVSWPTGEPSGWPLGPTSNGTSSAGGAPPGRTCPAAADARTAAACWWQDASLRRG
eukprot:366526-Chlamydomonas_euryale.AAC.5